MSGGQSASQSAPVGPGLADLRATIGSWSAAQDQAGEDFEGTLRPGPVDCRGRCVHSVFVRCDAPGDGLDVIVTWFINEQWWSEAYNVAAGATDIRDWHRAATQVQVTAENDGTVGASQNPVVGICVSH